MNKQDLTVACLCCYQEIDSGGHVSGQCDFNMGDMRIWALEGIRKVFVSVEAFAILDHLKRQTLALYSSGPPTAEAVKIVQGLQLLEIRAINNALSEAFLRDLVLHTFTDQ